MASRQIYIISREDRIFAFDHAGIPGAAHPSRATTYSVAEQMDADYVVFGDYDFDGKTFTAKAQLLDMKKLRLAPTVQSSGPLTSLIDIQTDLAWQLLNQLPAPPAMTRAAVPQVRQADPAGRTGEIHSRHPGHQSAAEDALLSRGHSPESQLHAGHPAVGQALL